MVFASLSSALVYLVKGINGKETVQASKKENGAFKTCLQSVSFPFSPHPSLSPISIVSQVKVKVKTLR